MPMNTIAKDIAFSMAKGMQGATALEMLRRIGSPEAFCDLPKSHLAALAAHDCEIFNEAYRRDLAEKANAEAVFVENNKIKTLFIGRENYPRRLSMCDDAPTLLYKLGSCKLDARHTVGIVGTRHATTYGIDFTRRLVADLAKRIDDLVIVSGLAFGIDVAAHKAALEHDVPTVGVLAHGLQMIYPAEHRDVAARMVKNGGALLTEYTSTARIFRGNFLARNRIVAGLCDCIVVAESDYRGGAMATANIARQYDREVMALPGRTTDLYSRGTNRLISNNTAALITCADDLIRCMGWQPKADAEQDTPKLFKPMTTEQKIIYDFIVAHPEATGNDICVALGITYASFSNTIFELEMDDAILALPGGRYAPTSLDRTN